MTLVAGAEHAFIVNDSLRDHVADTVVLRANGQILYALWCWRPMTAEVAAAWAHFERRPGDTAANCDGPYRFH